MSSQLSGKASDIFILHNLKMFTVKKVSDTGPSTVVPLHRLIMFLHFLVHYNTIIQKGLAFNMNCANCRLELFIVAPVTKSIIYFMQNLPLSLPLFKLSFAV